MKRHGIDIAALRRHHADLLCARCRHAAATAWTRCRSAGSATSRSPTRTSPARARRSVTFDLVDDRQGDRLCRRGCRRDAAAVAGAEAAARRRGPGIGLRAAGTAAGRRCWRAWKSAASPSTGRSCRACRANWRRGAAALEDEIYELAGERFNIGSPKQLGDILFGKMGLPGGTKTKTGQWSTSAQVLEDLAAEGHELPRKIVDWRQLTKLKSTYTDALPGYIHPRDQARPHLLCAGRDHDRPAVLVRAEPAEHSGAHRGRPQDPHGLHRRRPATSWCRPTTARSNCACSPMSPTSRSCGRPLPTASTSTR